ncbi:hypothetical protein OF829_09665 [Sphingomonas sp. LB-2]|uniref:hypothetical protein n=1 Tax=Sphingomonas caeni TaxID=2984949 RepID=UPI00222E7B04|nr:hypothetical protein [Sphingomonas caeni]MCW3847510.1 hypothetical protein [Sphingomonas caeni]
MPRPLTHPQRLQNAAFLEALRRTGNARLAARELGVHRATFTKRRARHAAFAAEWDATLAAAHAAFALAGGTRQPEPKRAPDPNSLALTDADQWRAQLRTGGGEPVITRTASGRLQLRLSPPDRMTRAATQAFLTALAATANVRLSAAAAGYAHTSIYARRKADPAFARQMDEARRIGLERLEAAMLEAATAAQDAEGPDAAWQHSLDANPIPPLTAAQAMQLLARHKRNEQHDEVDAIMRRRIPWELKRELLQARLEREKREEKQADARHARARSRAKRYETTGNWRRPNEPAPIVLPPLDQVTGWSKADPEKKPHREDVALFGGWRIGDWVKQGRG